MYIVKLHTPVRGNDFPYIAQSQLNMQIAGIWWNTRRLTLGRGSKRPSADTAAKRWTTITFFMYFILFGVHFYLFDKVLSGWILQIEESWVDSHRRKAIQVSWLRLQVFFISSFREKSISCHSAERSEHDFFSNRCKFCLITWYSSCNCSQVHPEEQS